MTFAQYDALVSWHNRGRKKRDQAKTQDASWSEIAALKTVKIASG